MQHDIWHKDTCTETEQKGVCKVIRLLKMADESGKEYQPGEVLVLLENGTKISAAAGENEEVIVWLPPVLRPERFEMKRLCNEILEDSDVSARIVWPLKVLYDSQNGSMCGFVAKNPHINGPLISLAQIIEQRKHGQMPLSAENKRSLIGIGMQLANYFQTVHRTRSNYVFGFIQPQDFYIDSTGTLFCFSSFVCAQNHHTEIKTYYIAPEVIGMQSQKNIYNTKTDAFVYALILFQLFTGKFPYLPEKDVYTIQVETIWSLMCDGESIFFDMDSEEYKNVEEILKGFSEEIKKAFHLVFDYCGLASYEQGRPTISKWLQVLDSSMGANR